MRLLNVILVSFILMSGIMSVQAKNIYGLYERVQLLDLDDVSIKAKLDTGALTSSLGATQIERFEKKGKEWIRFKPQVDGLDLPVIEKEIVRHSKIKLRNDDISDEEDRLHTKRPVVMMDLCFDGKYYSIEVNLTDRSRFNYPLLIGRIALIEFNAIVDPSLKFESKNQCNINIK